MDTLALRPERYGEAARTLAQAYRKDPALRWVIGGKGHGRRFELRLRWIFERRVARVAAPGASLMTPASEGIALWLPPEYETGGLTRFAHPRVTLSPVVLGTRAVARLARLERHLARRRRAMRQEPHWTLVSLAVQPRVQGEGVGRQLLAEGLARADAERRACFLITHNPRNLDLFADHGFEIVGDGPLFRGGPLTWSMRRQPAVAVTTPSARELAGSPSR